MCPILLKQNGTLIRRPRLRARASEMGGAGGARPRTWFAWFGAGVLVAAFIGGSAPLPPGLLRGSAASEAKQRTAGYVQSHPTPG